MAPLPIHHYLEALKVSLNPPLLPLPMVLIVLIIVLGVLRCFRFNYIFFKMLFIITSALALKGNNYFSSPNLQGFAQPAPVPVSAIEEEEDIDYQHSSEDSETTGILQNKKKIFKD